MEVVRSVTLRRNGAVERPLSMRTGIMRHETVRACVADADSTAVAPLHRLERDEIVEVDISDRSRCCFGHGGQTSYSAPTKRLPVIPLYAIGEFRPTEKCRIVNYP
jgi:hypothetical protein